MKKDYQYCKFNVSMKLTSLIFVICLLASFVLCDPKSTKELQIVQRNEEGATKENDALDADVSAAKSSRNEIVRLSVRLDSAEPITGELESVVKAPVNTVRRKKQAQEGVEQAPPPTPSVAQTTTPTEIVTETPATTKSAEQSTAPAESVTEIPAPTQIIPSEGREDNEPSLLRYKNLRFAQPQYNTSSDGDGKICKDGLIVRAWRPQEDVSNIEIGARGIIYFLTMCYLFLGIYIATNRFMESIEVITSNERNAAVINKNGKKEIIKVRVWNNTVANLILMALGSSAPEIILSVIEMFQKNFIAGDLGPGTIIGSAAFNLFFIIAVCIVAIPKDEVRRIEKYRVFIVTAMWSTFAYVWLCLVTKFITPEVIDLWEGLLTLIFFPLLIYHAYTTDRRLYCPSFYRTSDEREQQRGDVLNAAYDDDMRGQPLRSSIKNLIDGPEWRDFEQSRRDYIVKLKELHRMFPHYNLKKIEVMAQRILIKKSNKSIAFYRIQSSRRTTGGPRLILKSPDSFADDMSDTKALLASSDSETDDIENDDSIETRIHFAPSHYTVMENAGQVLLHVWRRGNLSEPIQVEYYTEDGTAIAGTDYVATQGVLLFEAGVEEQIIKIKIIDDDIIEDDEHFYVYLRNASEGAHIVTPKVASVMIFDDDHCGIFGFIEKVYEIAETSQQYEVKVVRAKGSRGKVLVPYFTTERTAIKGKDFEDANGFLEFKAGEVEKTITILIMQEHSLEKDVIFEVHIGKPELAEDDPLHTRINEVLRKPAEERSENENLLLSGQPKKGKLSMTTCHIVDSAEFRQKVNKLVQTAQGSNLIGNCSWKAQFLDALFVSGSWEEESDDDEDIEDDEGVNERAADKVQEAGAWEYFVHFLTIFWKICFAFIPPARMYKGYPCFFISLFAVGLCTAILGDVAMHFGCTLGVLDSVTAICLVALGTSLPDTFASRIAAKYERTADNAIGNVTGSNAVNVFLGIGLAWTVAILYHLWHGEKFRVPVGPILFSTVLFLIEAFIAFLILIWRRYKDGGELGGSERSRLFHCILFLSLWIIYITVSSLEAYDIIEGF